MSLVLLSSVGFDSGVEKFAQVGVASKTAYYEDRVLSFGEALREVPLLPELPRTSYVRVRLSNHDGYFSRLRALENFTNRSLEIYLADTERGEAQFILVFSGMISEDWELTDTYLDLPARDNLGSYIEKATPFIMNDLAFPNIPAETPRTIVPLVYGVVSSPTGAVPAYLIDPAIGSHGKYRYLAGQGTLKTIPDVFVYGVLEPSGWAVGTIPGPDGSTLTVIDFDADPRDPARTSELTITYNGTGLTDDGTTSGTAITNPALQLADILIRHGLPASQISTTLRDAAASHYDDLGVSGGVAVTQPSTLRDLLDRMANSFGLTVFPAKGGLVGMIAPKVEVESSESLVSIEYGNDMAAGSLKINGPTALATGADARFNLNFTSGEFLGSHSYRDTGEVGAQKRETNITKEMPYVRDVSHANTILQAVLFNYQERRQVIDIRILESFYSQIEVGTYVRFSHLSGPSVDGLGYRQRVFRVLALGIQENRGLLSTLVRLVDLEEAPPLFTLYEEDRSAPLFHEWGIPQQQPTLPGEILGL